MTKVLEFTTFALAKGVSKEDFLLKAKYFKQDFLAKDQGLIDHKLLMEGENFTDMAMWENSECAEAMGKNMGQSSVAMDYMSCIDNETVIMRHLEVIG